MTLEEQLNNQLKGLEQHLQRVEEKIDCLLKKIDLQSEVSTEEAEGDDVSASLETEVASNLATEREKLTTHNLEIIVRDYLRDIGVPANIRGYSYLIDAIIMGINDFNCISMITKLMYPTIAKNHQTSPTGVGRAIKSAIEVAWNKGNFGFQQKIFGLVVDSNKGNPTNGEFIAKSAEHIRLNLK